MDIPQPVLAKSAQLAQQFEKSGGKDFQNLIRAMGLPAVRVTFRELIHNGTASEEKKKEFRQRAEKISPLSETGSISIDIPGQTKKAHIILGECPKDHDFGKEIQKIYKLLPKKSHEEIRDRISFLIYLGRSIYAEMYNKDLSFQKEIKKYLPEDLDTTCLHVDLANTTLYINDEWPRRVGVLINFI